MSEYFIMQDTSELSKSGDALLSVENRAGGDRRQFEGRGSGGRSQRKSSSAGGRGKRRRVETLGTEEELHTPSLSVF